MVPSGHFSDVNAVLSEIYRPFQSHLKSVDIAKILVAMRTDKKNTHGKTFVILTRGPGRMEKVEVDLDLEIAPVLKEFIASVQN